MYRMSYAEVLEDSSGEGRRRERDLFARAIELMTAAQNYPPQAREMVEAMVFLQRLWTFLMKDLANSENGLPEQLKGQLISVGLWVMRESDRVVRGEISDVSALIEINSIIQEGLK